MTDEEKELDSLPQEYFDELEKLAKKLEEYQAEMSEIPQGSHQGSRAAYLEQKIEEVLGSIHELPRKFAPKD